MKRLLLYSGGTDSTLLLYKFRPDAAVFFQYGQKHAKELFYAQDHCEKLSIPLAEIDLMRLRGSSLVGGDGGVVVPARNAIFLAAAANYAEANGFDLIMIGCNGDDAEQFPDCRAEFVMAMGEAFVQAGLRVQIQAPFVGATKKEILMELETVQGVALDSTWSCYEGGEEPCGECDACKLRS